MRLAGRCYTALIAISSLTAVGRGDELQPLMTVPKAQPAAPAQAPIAPKRTRPKLTPPDEIPGTWVSDDAVKAAQAKAVQRAYLPPLPITAAYSQPMIQTPDGLMPPGVGAGPGPAGPGYAPDGQTGPMMGPGYSPGPVEGYSDGGYDDEGDDYPQGRGGADFGGLWNQVHTNQRVFVRLEYLSFWEKGNPLPPLVTTSPAGTPQAAAGVLGQPDTKILFGNRAVDDGQRNGGRVTLGYWFGEGQFNGIEGHYFALNQAGTEYENSQAFSTNPNATILARPFTEVGLHTSPTPNASLLAFPNYFSTLLGETVNLDGSIKVQTTSNVQSAGALWRHLMWTDFESDYRVDLLLGYRFFKVDDSVTINDSVTFSPIPGVSTIPIPVTGTSQDRFVANNQFHGGEIGMSGQFYWGRLSLDATGKVALGGVLETVRISGGGTISSPGTPTVATNVFQLLSQPTNIGCYSREKFAALPELLLNFRYDLTCHWRLNFGYNFMYLTAVQHSGSAIDTTVNTSQITGPLSGPARPAFVFSDTGLFVQGVTTGLEYRW